MSPPQLFSPLVLDGVPPTVWNESPVVPPSKPILVSVPYISCSLPGSHWLPPLLSGKLPPSSHRGCGHHFLQGLFLDTFARPPASSLIWLSESHAVSHKSAFALELLLIIYL